MLALSLKIENEEVSRSLAHFTVAICVSNTSIRFRFVQPGQAPWEHLAILFDVKEELPIGYEPPAYITSLHVELSQVYIDYRPLYLPTAALLSVKSFLISTILRPGSNKALLSMIGEDVCLLMTNRPPQDSQLAIDINQDR